MNYDLSKIKVEMKSRPEAILLIFFIVLIVASNLVWLGRDTRPGPSVDENIYLQKDLHFLTTMKSGEFNRQSIQDLVFQGRPPTYQVLSLPFILVADGSMSSALLVNLVFEIILIIATYKAGSIAGGKKAGLLAAIIVSTYPVVIRLSRIYRPYFALTPAVALVLWALLLLYESRSVKHAWLVSLSIAFGSLIHPAFLYGLPLPVLLSLCYLIFTSQPDTMPWVQKIMNALKQPFVVKGLLPSGLLSAGTIVFWYLTIGRMLFLQKVDIQENYMQSGEKTLLGPAGRFPDFLFFGVTAPQALSTIFVLFLVFGVFWTLKVRSKPAMLLVLFLVSAYLTHTFLQVVLSWRYVLQHLPVAAILTALWLANIKHPVVAKTLLIVTFVNSFFIYQTISWRRLETLMPVEKLNGMLTTGYCIRIYGLFCPDPPAAEDWSMTKMFKIITKDDECRKQTCHLAVLEPTLYPKGDQSYFNINGFTTSLWYEFERNFPGRDISIRPISRTNPIKRNLLLLMESEYLLYQAIPNENLNTAKDLSFLHFLNFPTPLFSSSHSIIEGYELPNSTSAILIKRVSPLTEAERLEVGEAIQNLAGQ